MVWSLPFSASVALRQIGLILFLAGIGTRAGRGFLATFAGRDGLVLFAAGAVITFVTALATLFVAHRVLKVPHEPRPRDGGGDPDAARGARLRARADPATRSRTSGYAAVYPAATIAKLLLVQLLVALG